VHTGIWWRELREGDHLANPGVNKRIILTFRVRHLNAVFVLRVRNFPRDGPLNSLRVLDNKRL
jgi:hypothetical protein